MSQSKFSKEYFRKAFKRLKTNTKFFSIKSKQGIIAITRAVMGGAKSIAQFLQACFKKAFNQLKLIIKILSAKSKQCIVAITSAIIGAGKGIIQFLHKCLKKAFNQLKTIIKFLGVKSKQCIVAITSAGTVKRKHIAQLSQAHFREAFNRLKTNIEFLSVESKHRVIAITSAVMGAGKSTVIANTAVAMANKNCKILLIDGDLRRPMIHKLFKATNQKGLTNTLQKNNWNEFILQTKIEGLDILTAGTTPPNPVNFLGSEKMGQVINDAKKEYDIILIDAPPVLVVPDILALSKHIDSIFLVVRSGRSQVPDVLKAKEELAKIKAPLEGIVFNDYSLKENQIYRYAYNSNYYIYGEEKQKEPIIKIPSKKQVKTRNLKRIK